MKQTRLTFNKDFVLTCGMASISTDFLKHSCLNTT